MTAMIARRIASVIREAARSFPVVSLFGPRQSGKTTLVRSMFPDYHYINLENPETRRFFSEDPKSLLKDGRESVIVDEVQREPELLSWIQVYADAENRPGMFILTGSNQPALSQAISQSLAGRTSIHYLLPLSLEELSDHALLGSRDDVLVNGCLPRLYDANVPADQLYSAYFATYVERDVRRLIHVRDMAKFETFVRLLAGRVGQSVNLSALGGDVGVSTPTISGWLGVLEASFLIMRVHPYHSNLGKRLVKTPKLYFTEPGLLVWLLQIETPEQVGRDPLLGNIFENMVMVEASKAAWNRGREPRLLFYRDKSGLEIDLIREVQRRPFAVEIKAGRTFTREMIGPLRRWRTLHGDLAGSALVYGGDNHTVIDGITVTPFQRTASLLFGET